MHNNRSSSPIASAGFAVGFLVGLLAALFPILRRRMNGPGARRAGRTSEADIEEERRLWAETRARRRELQARQREARELEEEWADELEQQRLDEE